MIKRGDRYKHTVEIGGNTVYHIHNICNGVVTISWEFDDEQKCTYTSLTDLIYLHKYGHIKFLSKNGQPPQIIRKHKFNVTPRDLPHIKTFKGINPYMKPKLFIWD